MNATIPKAEGLPTVMVAGNHLTVYAESPALVDDMLRDIAAAKQRVWLEVYWFESDEVGQRFAAALQERARAGVDVRVHYDAVGSTRSSTFWAGFAAAGVKVHRYHALWDVLKRFQSLGLFNRRNHRKLLVIDDQIGYFGGMNIVAAEPERHGVIAKLTESSAWRDVHLRLEGPHQLEMAESFARSWARAHGEKPPRRRKEFRQRLREIVRTGDGDSIHFFDSGRGLSYGAAGRIFSRLLRASRDSVTISMAYFIPVGGLLRSLLRARRRGVRFRIVVPGQSDVLIVQRATSYIYGQAIKRGFRIYERRARMLHAKVMIVDGLWTAVGSANMDPRSMYTNLEFLAVIRSRALAEVMQRICRFEIQHSERITLAHVRAVSRWQRFINMLAWSWRWWL